MSTPKFTKGDRVDITGGWFKGRTGVIVLHEGRAFNGWTVRLDHNGHFAGIDGRHMTVCLPAPSSSGSGSRP